MINSEGDAARRIELPDVTLVAVSSVAIPATVRALKACLRQVKFGTTLFLTDQPPPGDPHPEITWRRISPIRSRADYSHFMTKSLVDHVATSHALCVQWDGYLLDAARWDDCFLSFDYIGAPWPQFGDCNNVGNGGFSLRSRRLMNACANLPAHEGVAEDILICRVWRDALERAGIRFAPLDVARRFAFERNPRRGDEFGFHGIFNLVNIVHEPERLSLIKSLEGTLIAASERRELLAWALKHGRMRLALEFSLRIVAGSRQRMEPVNARAR